MARLDPNRCKKPDVVDETGFHYHQCRRKPWKDGWCKQHHPDSVREREKRSAERWKAEADRRMAPHRNLEKAKEELKRVTEQRDRLQIGLIDALSALDAERAANSYTVPREDLTEDDHSMLVEYSQVAQWHERTARAALATLAQEPKP